MGVNYAAYVLGWDTVDPAAIRTGKGRLIWELNRKAGAEMQQICYRKMYILLHKIKCGWIEVA